MKTTRTKAIVVRRTNYGEADRIVQFITPDFGKISVMARGVRREKSKLAGAIELFARCDITYMKGRGDLSILTSARLEQFYGSIIGDYDRLSFGYEAIKQVSKAADSLDESAFFDLLDQTYASLNTITISLSIVRMWFWLQLGILLGIGLNLSTDSNGIKLQQDEKYNFDESQGVFMISEKGRFTSDHIKLLRLASAQRPVVVAQVKGSSGIIDDCSWLAERSFAH